MCNNNIFEKQFKNPDGKYRSKPFWSWNGKLDISELNRQVLQLKKMGLSGALIHSRSGLITEYLGKEWFGLVNSVCETAEKNNFSIWLYDEDRWPSGTAGGIVTKDPINRQKRLCMSLHNNYDFEFDNKYIAVFKGKITKNCISQVQRIHDAYEIDKNNQIIAFRISAMPCTDWYNGGAYLDTLSEQSVKEFMVSTHDKYAENCGKHFGRTIKAVFTDEPHHESVLAPTIFAVQNNSAEDNNGYELPWTDNLPDYFRNKYGYEILDFLPYIIFDFPKTITNKYRHHYHDCITDMFVKSYAESIAKWAKKHNITSTGHIFWESPLSKMVSYVGSVMRFMEYFEMPAVDILSTNAVFTNGRNEYDSVKQCTSIANQFGKKHVLSEMYACCGWGFTPEQMKKIGDWQAVLGINTRCQSCFAYTITNDGKRDFPPSYFHIAWKDMFAVMEDYYARLNVFTSQGELKTELLVLHPNETMWQMIKADWNRTEHYKNVEENYNNLISWLLQSQIDFDYGDEEIMSRIAEITYSDDRPKIKIGKAKYSFVVVPDLLSIRATTLKLLEEFADNGGNVLFTGNIPSYIDGEKSDKAKHIAKKCIIINHNRTEITEALKNLKVIELKAENNDTCDILCSLREDESSKYIIIHNTCSKNNIDRLYIKVSYVNHEAYLYEANPFTGDFESISFLRQKDRICFETNLPPLSLKTFVIKNDTIASSVQLRQKLEPKCSLACQYKGLKFNNPNVCLLDFAKISIDGEKWFEDYLYNADIKIRKSMGWSQRIFNMLQPWADKEWYSSESIFVRLKYNINFSHIPSKLVLAMEKPERFEIKINGTDIENKNEGCFIDHSIRTLPINTHILQKGYNSIEMGINYHKSDGIENIFLLGDFAVDIRNGRPEINVPLNPAPYSNLTLKSYPFYYGSVTYNYEFGISELGEYTAKVANWSGAYCEIEINSKPAGFIAFRPYETDISKLVQIGKNRLSLTLISTSRNIFGPFHCNKPFRGQGWTDPRDYACPKFNKSNGYHLEPFGLISPPIINCMK